MKENEIIQINRGDVLHEGQGQLESRIFRIANMGVLFTPDIEGFLAAFKKVLESAAVQA